MNDLKEKNTMTDEVQKAMSDAKRKQQLKAYDAKLNELAENIEKTIEKHGQDYFMVDILTMFLDISLKMKEVMEMMSSMNMVMELFGDAVGFIDQSLSLQSDIMSETSNVKYNFWYKITTRRRNRKIIRNNINRITTISSNILTKYKMANDMNNSLQKVSYQLKNITKKMNPKQKKSKHKGGEISQYSDASRFLAERRSARGESATAFYSSAPQSSSAPSGSLDISGV